MNIYIILILLIFAISFAIFLHSRKISTKKFIDILKKNDIKLVKKYLKKLPDINQTIKINTQYVYVEEATPLIFSIVINNNIEIVKLLISSGADVNKADERKNTPIIYAALYTQQPEIIKLLVDNGADINAKNIINANSVMVSLSNSNIEILKQIISLGGDYDCQNKGGWNAIMSIALEKRPKEMCEILINAGANLSLKNKLGKTALDIAKENYNEEIVELLEKYT